MMIGDNGNSIFQDTQCHNIMHNKICTYPSVIIIAYNIISLLLFQTHRHVHQHIHAQT